MSASPSRELMAEVQVRCELLQQQLAQSEAACLEAQSQVIELSQRLEASEERLAQARQQLVASPGGKRTAQQQQQQQETALQVWRGS